jgi:hypothetical protein
MILQSTLNLSAQSRARVHIVISISELFIQTHLNLEQPQLFQFIHVRCTACAVKTILCVLKTMGQAATHPDYLRREGLQQIYLVVRIISEMGLAFKKALTAAIFGVGIVPASAC